MMALWEITERAVEYDGIFVISPVEILAEIEGVSTFTFRGKDGDLLLGHLCAVGANVSRYLACRTTDLSVADLKTGMLSLYDVLTVPPVWILDVASNGKVERAWEYDDDNLPLDVIPEPDVLLTPELEDEQAADERLALFAHSGSDGEMVFAGAPVNERHTIDSGFYGRFWESTNELWQAICEELEIGPARLGLGMTSESSYAVKLTVSEPVNNGFFEWKNGIDEDGKVKLRRAFDCLMGMLSNDQSADEATMMVKMNYPIRRELTSVLELVSKASGDVSVRSRDHPGLRTLSTATASSRLGKMKKLRLTVVGELVGGFVEKVARHDVFVIRCNVGDQASHEFSGQIESIAGTKLRGIGLGETVRATLQVRHADDKQAYILEDVEPARGAAHTLA